MAYSLKTTGIATNLLMCVAVDEDGTTVKEFVSADVNTNKTTTGVTTSSATWKGTSRGYFVVSGTSGSPNCVQFPATHRPAWAVSDTDGGAIFMALSGSTNASGTFVIDDNGAGMLGRAAGTVLTMNGGGRSGTTTPPSDGTTKWSGGGNYHAFTDWQIYYGLESGSLAQDATGSDAGTAATLNITGVGGWAGFSVAPANYHIAAIFNRTLTLVEMQSLHNDWFGTLFAAPAVITATVTLTSDGTTPRASLTGLKWAWFDQVTPNLFVAPTDKGAAATTNASGVMTVTLTNTAKTAGQVGWLVVTDSDGTVAQSPSAKAFAGPVTVA